MSKYAELKKLAEVCKRQEYLPTDFKTFFGAPVGWVGPQILALIAENERLNDCLKWEQHRAERIGTHGPGCESWGSNHYECLLQKFGQMCAKNDVLDIQVAILQSDENSWQSGYDKGRADGAKRSREEVSQLRAEVEALRTDAERYKFHRDVLRHDRGRWENVAQWNNITADRYDAAIDIAMSQEGNSDG